MSDMPERLYEDLRREGINTVASLMGHIAAGSSGPRLSATEDAINALSESGLGAAVQYVQDCRQGLNRLVRDSMLPPAERQAYRKRREAALIIAEDMLAKAVLRAALQI